MGRYVSVVDIQRTNDSTEVPTDKIAHQLCQHVIGMDPKEIGTPETEDEKQASREKADLKRQEKESANRPDDADNEEDGKDDFGV